MRRRDFLAAAAASGACAGAPAPVLPIDEAHFPSRLHQYVWRNWELANTERMAEVIGAPPAAILQIGASMGLPAKRRLTGDQLSRIYITAIRQNWHLLPEDQIVRLLGWDRARFDFTLKEDDGLDIKLGRRKPECAPLRYAPPTAAERAAAARIRNTVREVFGEALYERGEDSFAFVKELSDSSVRPLRAPGAKPSDGEINLSRGWSIDGPPTLSAAAERFRHWLEQAMGARLVRSGAEKRMRLALSPSAGPAESFRIRASPREILVEGGSPAAILRGLDLLRDRMEQREGPFLAPEEIERRAVWNPRYVYSYFALYGDPLMEPERDPFPDGMLERLARRGINGVWMQAVLNTLAPSPQFPEFGKDWQTRLKNLNAMVERASRHGIRIFLYLNEPRAMPPAFFVNRPGICGSSHLGLNAMCTSAPEVREWIAGSLARVTQAVPGLGGFFSITMSENHTNCFSHGGAWGANAPNAGDCPRCRERASWDVIAEVISTFRDGIRRASRDAELIAWDWGWGDALAEKLIPLLPKDVGFLSISEWDAPVRRGGVDTRVGEYSMSVVGPGPRAQRNWSRAKAVGLKRLAKTQFNNTWEISAVPYIPAPQLVLEHCENLARAGVSGVQASWTCGGYPSPNLQAAAAYYFEPRPPKEEILNGLAATRYGRTAAAGVVEAWRQFSEAFREFPYGVSIYIIPVQHGPANLLRTKPTGHPAGMILFPHDQYKAWSGRYPPEVVRSQFGQMARLWAAGLETMERALARVPASKRPEADLDLAIARTCYHHFRSVANQVEFYLLRDGKRTPEAAARMRDIARDEIDLARRQYPIARRHSVIAYEASNHYYYRPLDLVEKVLNCRRAIEDLT